VTSQRTRLGLISLLVTALAILFIINQIDLDLFWQALVGANYWYLLPCIFLLLVGLVTRALRWRVLLGQDVSLVRAFQIMNVAYLANGVLPMRLGEVARIYLAKRAFVKLPAPQIAATIVVERLLDLFAVVVMVMVSLMLATVPQELEVASRIAAISGIVGIAGILVLLWQRSLLRRIAAMISRRLTFLNRYFSLETVVHHFLDGLASITQPRVLLQVVFWTVLSWIVSTMAGYVLMFAFWDQASLAATLLYIAAAAFAIAVPAIPGNIGTYEASILLALAAAGYTSSNQAVAFAITVHAVNVVVHMSTGMVGLMQEGITFAQLSERVQEIRRTDTQIG
jgi:hypothetical protein